MPKRPTFEYEIVIHDHEFEPFPFTLPDGSLMWGVATVTVEFNAHLDSWNYPDAANTRHEEITIADHRVSIELSDITAFDSDGNEVPATEELRQHLIASFSVEDFHEEMCEEFENANDSWNSADDDRPYDD
jgi:hypothetical protein